MILFVFVFASFLLGSSLLLALVLASLLKTRLKTKDHFICMTKKSVAKFLMQKAF